MVDKEEVQFTRNRHYGRLMRDYMKLLDSENFFPEEEPGCSRRIYAFYLYPISISEDQEFYRFINVAGISVKKGKIMGLDGIYLGSEGNISRSPLACKFQKQLSDF